MAKIVLDNLGKHFGGVVAVQGLNLAIADGEFIALLGPSGCGKTTTLLMLAGIYKPTHGIIRFDDVVVNELPPQDRHIGMVFQSYALYPHMNVFDNIAFPLRLLRRPTQEIKHRVAQVVTLVQIEGLLGRKPAELSGGQQQRVALARALVKEPTLLLLDEPLSNLDAKLRVIMRAEIKRLQRKLGITTVLVTHDQVEAMTMADRIAILKDTLLQQVGSPADLYERPANTFVGGFVGNPPMNFLPATVTMMDGRLAFDAAAFWLWASPRVTGSLIPRVGGTITLGIRPEDIALSLTPGSGPIQGKILDVEPLGRELVVAVALGAHYLIALAPPAFGGKPDEPVWLSMSADRIYAFDATSESALG